MSDKRRELEELRLELGSLDGELLAVLEKRAKLSKRAGHLKQDLGLVVTMPDRAEVEAIVGRGTGELPTEALREVFGCIVANCFALERPLRVAFCGLEGAFAHAAAQSQFGHAATYQACDTAAATLDEVSKKSAFYAVVPYETRTEGLIQVTIAALTSSDLKIVKCFDTVVNLQLASRASSVAEVEKVYASAKDRAHAQRFFALEVPGALVLDVKSPAAACQLAASDPRAAALAHESVAEHYGLGIIKRNVRDEGDDRVRYAVISPRPSSRTGNDLTAIVFAVSDSPGALHEILRQLAERTVNLTKIQSRPTPSDAWQYVFFIEVQGHATDRSVIGAIEEIRRLSKFFKVLGSYQSL